MMNRDRGPSPPWKWSGAAEAVSFGGKLICAVVWLTASLTSASEPDGADRFHRDVAPILSTFCFECHGNGSAEADVSLDGFESDPTLLKDRKLWMKAIKQLRAGMMPPPGEERPSPEQQVVIEDWIKTSVFEIDPANPDPGRVTLHRLNRIEYQNTIRDLMGVSFDAFLAFPADDSGHGFDNIGDVLSISPLLLEKYLLAASAVVSEAVPRVTWVPAEHLIQGGRFEAADAPPTPENDTSRQVLSYYLPASVSTTFQAPQDGDYELVLNLIASDTFVEDKHDLNKTRLKFNVDGQTLIEQEFGRQEYKPYRLTASGNWKAGEHRLEIVIEPLTPDQPQTRSLRLAVDAVTVRGPLAREYWVHPPGYEKYFPREIPEDAAARRAYAVEILGNFAKRAFRRPAEPEAVERLAGLAESIYSQPDHTFESGIAEAMTATLASPRFLFREEGFNPASSTDVYPLVDEYALASRLSYFLWSTMPDDELFRLADEHKLREHLSAQVQRMLADSHASEFMRNFPGQWLQARDVDNVMINATAVLSRDEVRSAESDQAEKDRARFRELRRNSALLTNEEIEELKAARKRFFAARQRFAQFELSPELRKAMRQETELLFEHIVRNDRSVLELLDCDYTFLNEPLAKYYGIEGVAGSQMQYVALPADSPRGGILTQGTFLTVTSNPNRTSPVKRGSFILDNILGTPPAPPPPDVPPLNESAEGQAGRSPTLRETLELHRADPSCASCHARMDPLGLAFENFNALSMWRSDERGTPINATGDLVTGESFHSVQELKLILVTTRRTEFYCCLTEKLLTYALGRGLEDYDTQTVDTIVERLEQSGGRASVLVQGIIESAPFQKQRRPEHADLAVTQ